MPRANAQANNLNDLNANYTMVEMAAPGLRAILGYE
jgi:hypothetical protein